MNSIKRIVVGLVASISMVCFGAAFTSAEDIGHQRPMVIEYAVTPGIAVQTPRRLLQLARKEAVESAPVEVAVEVAVAPIAKKKKVRSNRREVSLADLVKMLDAAKQNAPAQHVAGVAGQR
jgi:hypothetical protein